VLLYTAFGMVASFNCYDFLSYRKLLDNKQMMHSIQEV